MAQEVTKWKSKKDLDKVEEIQTKCMGLSLLHALSYSLLV
jgi:hypothetical protein